MTDVLRAMKLDFYTAKANYKIFLIVYALAIFLMILTAQPILSVVVVMFYAAIYSNMIFSIIEKNNMGKLYGILPIGESKIVLGRYLFALLFGVLNETVIGVLAAIISLLAGKSMDQLEFSAYLSFLFLYVCLSVAVSFPIYFRFGFSKAYKFAMLPIYIIGMAVFLLSRLKAFNVKQFIDNFINNPALTWVAGIGLGLVLLVISCPLSCVLYKRIEL